ncbi:hypothetical protein BDZ97DRAFT_1923761 [Flammula alnicola]|nr:hypothetical protein BDZ97DRAFT_1923761 [Flammula alnicola]
MTQANRARDQLQGALKGAGGARAQVNSVTSSASFPVFQNQDFQSQQHDLLTFAMSTGTRVHMHTAFEHWHHDQGPLAPSPSSYATNNPTHQESETEEVPEFDNKQYNMCNMQRVPSDMSFLFQGVGPVADAFKEHQNHQSQHELFTQDVYN